MNLKKFSELLNGRQIGDEVWRDAQEIAKRNKFIIIYGASDDLAEINGCIRDEVGVYDGGTIAFYASGLLKRECEDEDCPHEDKRFDGAKKVHAKWEAPGKATWSYETDIPHETFKIYDGPDLYCEGIVFSIEDIQ